MGRLAMAAVLEEPDQAGYTGEDRGCPGHAEEAGAFGRVDAD